jgi:dihydrofolate reductase
MRKLIYAFNLTLDGCCDHTKQGVNKEILDYYTNLVRDADTFVYGRITYQLMVPYWPDIAKNNSGDSEGENEYAQAFDAIDKIVVFSRTLDKAEGKNTEIVRKGLQDEILKLKRQPGKNILTGGVDLPSQLVQLDLIDEYRFVIHPTIAGKGRRLWDDVSLPKNLPLELVESKFFESGAVALRYLRS